MIGYSCFFRPTRTGTVSSSAVVSSPANLNLTSIHLPMECLSYSLLPNLINSSPAPNNSSTFLNTSSGKWVCCHFLDTARTWETVSHNSSTCFPWIRHFTMHLRPTSFVTPAYCLGVKWQGTSCSKHRQHLQLLFFLSSCIASKLVCAQFCDFFFCDISLNNAYRS